MSAWGKLASSAREYQQNLQDKKLHDFINNYIYPFSPYYKRVFDEHKIDPRKIKTAEDLKAIPYISKADFFSKERPEQYKDFILQPNKELIAKHWPLNKKLPLLADGFLHGKDYVEARLIKEFRPVFMTFTTGTTNSPVAFFYSNYDIANLYTSGARMLELFNVPPQDRILNMFPYAPHLAFWQVVCGGFAANILALSTGGGKVMGTEGNITFMLKMKPSLILGVPSYVYHVLRTAQDKGADLSFIKKIVLGASRVTIPFKKKLAEMLESMGARDVQVFGTYGFTESRAAWAECPSAVDVSSGYHLYPDKEIFEIIDPKTGEVKGEGEDGEIVYTSLDARASVVLRYRTGDFVKGGITYEPCPFCKRTVARLSADITRLSDIKDLQLSKIKGALVNLNHFTAVLSDVELIDEWQIEIRKRNNDPFDVDELVVYISLRDESADKAQLTEEIKKEMAVATEVSPNAVTFIPRQEMIKRLEIETANKERRIIDTRPKD